MFNHLDRRQQSLFGALCLNFAVLGIIMALFGATLPQIINQFAWNYLESGMVMAALSVGSLLANLLCGLLLRHWPAKAVLAGGLAAAVAGLGLFGQSPSWVANALLAVLIGLGQGSSEVVTNAVVVRLERPGESRLMNLMHAWFCVGAVAGPLGVAAVNQTAVPFYLVFLASGLIQLAVAGILASRHFPDMAVPGPGNAAGKSRQGIGRLPGHPLLLLFATMLFLYVGVELAMSNWIAEYFARCRALPAAWAALMVSVFWAGLLAGRLALGFWYKGQAQARLLVVLTGASVLCFGATLLVPWPALSALAALLTGLCFSGCYPVIMTLTGQAFQGSTAALGLAAMAGGTGLLVFPLATGALAQSLGLDRALLWGLAVAGLLAVLALAYLVRQRRALPPYRQ